MINDQNSGTLICKGDEYIGYAQFKGWITGRWDHSFPKMSMC